MGRPSMIPSFQDVPLPYVQTTEGQGVTRSAESISADRFFYENTRLTGILIKILSKIYRSTDLGSQSNPSRTPDVDIQSVLNIECALEEFESTLLSALHWNLSTADPERSPASKRQSNVFHARYGCFFTYRRPMLIRFRFLHLKLLMYCPAFSEYCSTMMTSRGAGGENMGRSTPAACSWTTLFLGNCASKCVQAAGNLV